MGEIPIRIANRACELRAESYCIEVITHRPFLRSFYYARNLLIVDMACNIRVKYVIFAAPIEARAQTQSFFYGL